MSAHVSPRALDVLENFFQGEPSDEQLNRLSVSEIQDLGDRVRESADAEEPAASDAVYPGGWLAANWMGQWMQGDLSLALLYHPRLLLHDPLADLFFDQRDRLPEFRPLRARDNSMSLISGPQMWASGQSLDSAPLEVMRVLLQPVVRSVFALAPLLRSGEVVMRSQWNAIFDNQQALLSSVAHDVRDERMAKAVEAAAAAGEPVPLWDNLRGMNATPQIGLMRADRPWQYQYEFYFLAKTLAVADAAGATYVPPSTWDLNLLSTKLQTIGGAPARRFPERTLREIAAILVPDLQLSPRTATTIRRDEEAFEDWRRTVRRLERSGASLPDREHAEMIRDELAAPVLRMKKRIARSPMMSSALKDASATTLISATGAAVGAQIASEALVGGLAGAGVSGVVEWLIKSYLQPRPAGADRVIYSLLRSSQ